MKQTHIKKKKKKKYEIILLYIHCPFWSFTPQKATFINASQTPSFFIMHFLTAFTKHSAF